MTSLANSPSFVLSEVTSAFNEYLARYPGEMGRLHCLYNELSHRNLRVTHRKNVPCHITASGIVFNKERTRVLTLVHKVYGLRMQPGGHLDEGETPVQAAIREVMEETGVMGLLPILGTTAPLHISMDTIPERPEKGEVPHSHFDFKYAFCVEGLVTLIAQDEEVRELEWTSVAELLEANTGSGLGLSLRDALRKLYR